MTDILVLNNSNR